jgi:predicted MFS family arabinose efflux permease
MVVYLVDPTNYSKVLMLELTTNDRYPLPSTLFLVALLIFISVLIFGVTKHWRWLFWLLLIANSFSILEVPATILQLTGVIPDPYPVLYSLYRMSIAVIQVGIAIWMVRIYYQYGVWGMGKKKQEHLTSTI